MKGGKSVKVSERLEREAKTQPNTSVHENEQAGYGKWEAPRARVLPQESVRHTPGGKGLVSGQRKAAGMARILSPHSLEAGSARQE